MKTPTILLATAALSAFVGNALAQPAAGDPLPDRYIVQLNADANPEEVAAAHGVAAERVYRAALNGFAGFVPPGRLRRLENDPRVQAVVPDRVITIGVRASKPGNGKPGGGQDSGGSSQLVPEGLKRIGAHQVQDVSGAGIGVAVADTGLDYGHADLAANISGSYFDAFGSNGQDAHGHGTHVGGTISALNNNQGVVGVAPNATLYSVRVLDANGSGSDSGVMAGLEWVLQNSERETSPIRVVNMSLGRPGDVNDNPALRQAVQNLVAGGITVVVAAGNDCGSEVFDQVPSSYPEVISVASTTAKDGKANRWGQFISGDTASYFTTDGAYSSGNGGVTISAPGEDQEDVNNGGLIQSVGILSTALGGGTTRMSGTSMASPHVAGVVALLYEAAGGSFDPEAARVALIAGADGANSLPRDAPTSCYTFDGDREGILNAVGALFQ